MQQSLAFLVLSLSILSWNACGDADKGSQLQSETGWQSPTKNCITGRFKENIPSEAGHLGMDFRGVRGTDVYPIGPGYIYDLYHFDDEKNYVDVVIVVHNTEGSYGKNQSSVVYSSYQHINRNTDLTRGQAVDTNTVIAKVAATRYADHLHLSMFDHAWIKFQAQREKQNAKSRLCWNRKDHTCVAQGYANKAGRFEEAGYWHDPSVENGGSILDPAILIPDIKDCPPR